MSLGHRVCIVPAMTLVLLKSDVRQVVDMDAVIGAVESSMRELGDVRRRTNPAAGPLHEADCSM